MGWFILAHFLSTMLAFIGPGCGNDADQDLEILILRHQLNLVAGKQHKPFKPTRPEKLILAVLVHKLKRHTHRSTQQLWEIVRSFQPETVLKWHRERVRSKWTYQRKQKGGRPRLNPDIENSILRLAKENPRWGYGKLEGELLKLGIQVSRTTIRNVLDRHQIVPVSVRSGSLGWRQLMLTTATRSWRVISLPLKTITLWLAPIKAQIKISQCLLPPDLMRVRFDDGRSWVA